jgi:sugar phosphate permease
VTSWRNVFAAVGISSLAGAALTWLLVRDRPADAGLPSMRALEGRAEHAPHPGPWWDGVGRVLRNRSTWPGFFVNLGLGGAYIAFAGLWAGPYLRAVHGMTNERASVHTFVMLLGFAACSLPIGWVSDRLRRRRRPAVVLGVVHLACWIALVAGVPLPGAASLALFAVLGLSAPAFTLSWASVKEVNPPALSGTAMAVANTGVFLGTMIYQPLVGLVLDRWGWRPAMLVLGVCVAGGVLSAALVRETFCRNVAAEDG